MYTTVQKFGISKKNSIFIQQDCIKWLKRDNKDSYNGTKYFNKKKVSYFEIWAGCHQKILKKITVSTKITTVLNMIIRNTSWAPNHCIKMFYEWSRDTENWVMMLKIQIKYII